RLVEINETVKVPKYSEVLNLPEEKTVTSDYVNYDGKYTVDKRIITFSQTASYGKRVYEADEWTPFKDAVKAQQDFSNEAIIIAK
ncbi:MAG: hypothetical protein M0P35_08075, partial [Bacteroidales bacterium]|nr:hypothetical protein [Bacteroidales bacterium]